MNPGIPGQRGKGKGGLPGSPLSLEGALPGSPLSLGGGGALSVSPLRLGFPLKIVISSDIQQERLPESFEKPRN